MITITVHDSDNDVSEVLEVEHVAGWFKMKQADKEQQRMDFYSTEIPVAAVCKAAVNGLFVMLQSAARAKDSKVYLAKVDAEMPVNGVLERDKKNQASGAVKAVKNLTPEQQARLLDMIANGQI